MEEMSFIRTKLDVHCFQNYKIMKHILNFDQIYIYNILSIYFGTEGVGTFGSLAMNGGSTLFDLFIYSLDLCLKSFYC